MLTVTEPSDPQAYVQANVGGQLADARQPMLSPLDRSFLYGDAVYEVWRTYDGIVFGWREHWERLLATMAGIGMELAFAEDVIWGEILRAVQAWREKTGSEGELYIRLQISRGAGMIGLATELAIEQNFVIYVKELPKLSEAGLDKGMTLSLCRKWRRNPMDSLPPALKTGNYLNNILGLKEARENGADDALFLNREGAVTEASTRNVWFVFKDRIVTPPLCDGLLAGVTRRFLLEKIPECSGLPLLEERVLADRVPEAEECFLTSSTQDVQPVCRIDDFEYSLGEYSVGRGLKRRFQELVEVYNASHGERLALA